MRALLFLSLLTSSTLAYESNLSGASNSLDKAQVTFVSVSQQFDGSWCFKTSVRHNDEGWEHSLIKALNLTKYSWLCFVPQQYFAH